MTTATISRIAVAALALTLSSGALMAQSGPWDGPGDPLGRGGHEPAWQSRNAAAADGRIEIARFRAEGEAATTLRSGTIAVVAAPGGAGGTNLRQDATFQAAVENELLQAGYQAATAGAGGQIAEVRIVRSEVQPAEVKRKPVSGEMSVGLSNRGSMLGLGLYVDATKPRKALLSTLLETRIRDRASGAVLWEGRAAIATRDGDAKWNDSAIAERLSHALFDGFPLRTGAESLKR
ncbi:hypothetical protein ACFFF7_12725 [Novosphingobium aquiterrae]|uniref:DUF4136 domain-containing protein n=1 Tax=Novosphingobium aquiterrae TaxID=624388 RepID=A0ABV6PKD2_9SPHN